MEPPPERLHRWHDRLHAEEAAASGLICMCRCQSASSVSTSAVRLVDPGVVDQRRAGRRASGKPQRRGPNRLPRSHRVGRRPRPARARPQAPALDCPARLRSPPSHPAPPAGGSPRRPGRAPAAHERHLVVEACYVRSPSCCRQAEFGGSEPLRHGRETCSVILRIIWGAFLRTILHKSTPCQL